MIIMITCHCCSASKLAGSTQWAAWLRQSPIKLGRPESMLFVAVAYACLCSSSSFCAQRPTKGYCRKRARSSAKTLNLLALNSSTLAQVRAGQKSANQGNPFVCWHECVKVGTLFSAQNQKPLARPPEWLAQRAASGAKPRSQ